MKTFIPLLILSVAAFTTGTLRADCANGGLEATLEFSTPSDDPATPCYEVRAGQTITLEACVQNCSASPQYVRVDLYASATRFDACGNLNRAQRLSSNYIVLAPGERQCITRTIAIGSTSPAATIYYQLRAQTASRRGPQFTDCSELECVTIIR